MQDTVIQSGPDVGEREGTVLWEQMRKWDLTRTLANPLNVARIPPKLVHIQEYAMDMAYVPPYKAADTRKTFKNLRMKY
jgi:glycogen synthase